MNVKREEFFEKTRKNPLVGDNVEIEVLDEQEKTRKYYKYFTKNERIDPTGSGKY